MKKVVFFAFSGEYMSFIHVLLNALDMNTKGYDVKIVIEGAATKLIPEMTKEGNPLQVPYKKAKTLGLVDGVCRTCSSKTGTLEAAEAQGLRLLDDMAGHPGIARYIDQGYIIITF
jgi:hypothetical protein